MSRKSPHSKLESVWELAMSRHGVVTRSQLVERGFSRNAIEHRLAIGRLHRIHAGVYAVGRPALTRRGRWMAAVLACGDGAVLSHLSATALYAILEAERELSITIPMETDARFEGIEIHRADLEARDRRFRDRIPVTSPARTLLDIAPALRLPQLERAINEADKRGLITPDALRAELKRWPGRRGVAKLRDLLDRDTFRITDSELERRFLRIARSAGLGTPETGVKLNGFAVDFLWRDLGLVVETDGLTYHRTPLQQARDRRRDQAHAAAGLTTLRFTHRQVASEPAAVARTLAAVAARLARAT